MPSTFGDTTGGTAFTAAQPSDQAILTRATLTEPAFAQSLELDVQTVGVDVQAFTPVIYTDAAGTPGTLVLQGSTTLVAPGLTPTWIIAALPLVQLAAAVYWIGILCGPTGGSIEIGRTPAAGATDVSADTFADGPAPVYQGNLSSTTDLLAVYVNYTTALLPPGRRKVNYDYAGAF